MTVSPPLRFVYQLVDKRYLDQWHVLERQGGEVLGSICVDDGGTCWMAKPRGDDAFTPGFETQRHAALWLWISVDREARRALVSRPMNDQPKERRPDTEFTTLVKRAGLTTSMAARIINKNPRTARRLASGLPEMWSDGTMRRPPAELTIPDRITLTQLAEENERALQIEATPEWKRSLYDDPPDLRPLQTRLLREAIQREFEEGRIKDRGNGPVRMMRQVERTRRRSQHEQERQARQEAAKGALP